MLVGDLLCVLLECDHEHSAEGGPDGIEDSYCDEVREETVCSTHSRFAVGDLGYEELTHSEPWPCRHSPEPVR
ncbi:hypothetical protein [Streptomyces achromogenes]|uniref:hypothetical protein n=1 Tax=Streptomyces achromogenes TaxID=67255 RepID=UPI003676747C